MEYRSGLSSFIRDLPENVVEYGISEPLGYRTLMQRPVREARIYQDRGRNTDDLRPGDRVNHPAFGHGVISKFMDGEKVEVLFRDAGRKLLHLEYTTLEKI